MRTSTALLLALLPLLASAGSNVTTASAFFRSPGGAALILRGVNVAADSKLPPFRAVADPVAAFADLPAHGVTVARVLFTWEAYEPEPGVYDGQYLDYVASLVRALSALDILSIIDMHQDAYARVLDKGCGDGFPEWAVSPRAAAAASVKQEPTNTNATTGARCAAWLPAALLDVPTAAAWADFYDDASGARSAFVNVWRRVAAALASEPGVLGYDILNEPALSEKISIAPLYTDVADAIRGVDPGAVILLGASLTSAGGAPTLLPDLRLPNTALAVHYYPPPGTPTLVAVAGAGASLAGWSAVAQKWGVPLFVGEYGAQPTADTAHVVSAEGYIAGFTSLLNSFLIGGTQWAWTAAWSPARGDGWNSESFSVVDAAGAPRSNWPVVPYPPVTAGTPVKFVADGKGRTLAFEWEGDASVAPAATRVFAPAASFFGVAAADVVFDTQPPSLACAYDDQAINIECGACVGACGLKARRR